MGDSTGIEWTDATWNPVTGCDRVSPGCVNCYAEAIAKRFAGTKAYPDGFKVTLHPERLEQPLRWRKPRRIFVNSMSDLFHRDIPNDFIAKVFDTMLAAPQHTFQVLTKRPERMRRFAAQYYDLIARGLGGDRSIVPYANVWLGVSIESNEYAWRADMLRETPAAVRFLSVEPMLGFVDRVSLEAIDWVICGGESGPHARPIDPAWVRDLRDRCAMLDRPDLPAVPFFFKQWGEYAPVVLEEDPGFAGGWAFNDPYRGGRGSVQGCRRVSLMEGVVRAGKARAGRVLDGRTWEEYPCKTLTPTN